MGKDREQRIVSDLNSRYLSREALEDIERLGVELREGAPLTVCDYDGDEHGNPTWLVVDGVAGFDTERAKWYVSYTMDDVHWEPREE
jgi:hypothetical protein